MKLRQFHARGVFQDCSVEVWLNPKKEKSRLGKSAIRVGLGIAQSTLVVLPGTQPFYFNITRHDFILGLEIIRNFLPFILSCIMFH